MNLQPTVLIVDDEKHTRDGLRSLLENEYDVYVAPDISGAINVLEREQIDVLLTDLRLGSEDGMTLIDRALKMPRPPACIMMTAYGSVDVAVEAMKHGAYDSVTKPLNLDKVELLIARAVQGRKLEQENRDLREQVDERYGLENIWGDSAALHEMLDTIRQVAPSSANVFFFQAEDGIRDFHVTGVQTCASSDLAIDRPGHRTCAPPGRVRPSSTARAATKRRRHEPLTPRRSRSEEHTSELQSRE